MERLKIFLRKEKIFIFIFIFILILIFFFGIIYINNYRIETSLIKSIPEVQKINNLNSNLPTRIKIPSIKVDTFVESVGLTKDGAMDAPLGPINTAWFNLGFIPGEIGSAVIDGHSGWKDNIQAVFDDLYKLKKGDIVSLENGKGEITIFIVREIRTYDPKADATNVFFSNDKKSHLNLIACTGIWDKNTKSHSKRLVVFTDKK